MQVLNFLFKKKENLDLLQLKTLKNEKKIVKMYIPNY